MQPDSGETNAEFTSPFEDSGVFAGTNTPFKTFWDYLETEKGIDAFHKDFPRVRREQTRLLMKETNRHLNERVRAQSQKSATHLQELQEQIDSLLQQQEKLVTLPDQQNELLRSLTEQQEKVSRLCSDALTSADKLAAEAKRDLERARRLSTEPAPTPSRAANSKRSSPSPVPNPTPTAAPAPSSEPVEAEVIELSLETATRDLTLRLSERDYRELLKRAAEGGFTSLQSYFNNLLLVSEVGGPQGGTTPPP